MSWKIGDGKMSVGIRTGSIAGASVSDIELSGAVNPSSKA